MPRHPPIALTTLDRSHCQCSSLVWFSKPILFARAQRGAEPDHPGKPEFAAMDHVRLTIMRTQTDTVTFYNRVQNDAIDVFNRSALSELRRAARLQPVIRPASRDQIRCRAVRQRQSDRASDAIPKNGEQRTIQSDRLPTSSNPSPISGRLGHQKVHQERVRTPRAFARNTWKPPDQSSLHNVDRTGIRPSGRCKLYFLQRIFVSLSRHQVHWWS